MKKVKWLSLIGILALSLIIFTSCGDKGEEVDNSPENVTNNQEDLKNTEDLEGDKRLEDVGTIEDDEERAKKEQENEATKEDLKEEKSQENSKDIDKKQVVKKENINIDKKLAKEENDEKKPAKTTTKDDEKIVKKITNKMDVLDFDDTKIAEAKKQTNITPDREIDKIAYQSQKGDAVTFKYNKDPEKMWASVTIKLPKGLEIKAEKNKYQWMDFSDELEPNVTVVKTEGQYKGQSLYEKDVIIDGYETDYRYFDEKEGGYYEVKEMMMGDFTGDKEKLTKEIFPSVYNLPLIENILEDQKNKAIYNPISIPKGKTVFCEIVKLDGKNTIYREVLGEKEFVKEWIDLKSGVTLKALNFDEKGLVKNSVKVSQIIPKKIEDNIFKKPEGIDFEDKTMMILAFTGMVKDTGLEAFGAAMEHQFKSENDEEEIEKIALRLNSKEEKLEVYAKGFNEGMNGFSLKHPVYVYVDSYSKEKVREVSEKRFYSIFDKLKKVVIYDKSCREKKFFDVKHTYLMDISKKGNVYSYKFYDPQNYSVSGLHRVYEYVVENNQFKNINTYMVESFAENKPIGNVEQYTVEDITFDENVYDEKFLTEYEKVDSGKDSVYDGEHPLI